MIPYKEEGLSRVVTMNIRNVIDAQSEPYAVIIFLAKGNFF